MCTLSEQMNKGEGRISCQVFVLDQVDCRALGLYQHIYGVCNYRQHTNSEQHLYLIFLALRVSESSYYKTLLYIAHNFFECDTV